MSPAAQRLLGRLVNDGAQPLVHCDNSWVDLVGFGYADVVPTRTLTMLRVTLAGRVAYTDLSQSGR